MIDRFSGVAFTRTPMTMVFIEENKELNDKYTYYDKKFTDHVNELYRYMNNDELLELYDQIEREYSEITEIVDETGNMEFLILSEIYKTELMNNPKLSFTVPRIKMAKLRTCTDIKELIRNRDYVLQILRNNPSLREEANKTLTHIDTYIQTSDISLFPGTDISIKGALDTKNIVSTYLTKWKSMPSEKSVVDLIPFEATKYKTYKISNMFSSQLFINTLVKAAAENLKSNGCRMIQYIPNVHNVLVVGDIHGDLPSLLMILHKYTEELKEHPETCIIFLGDYVDRGLANLEVIFILALLKTKFPSRVYLCRGNHECSDSFIEYRGRLNGNIFQNLVTRSDDIENTYMAYIIFICSMSFIVVVNDLHMICMHGGMRKGRLPINEPLPFLPTVPPENPLYTVIWSDYPNIERERLSCPDALYTPKDMADFMTCNGLRTYVKGHCHPGANNQIHTETKNIYVVISTVAILGSVLEPPLGMKNTYSETKINTVILHQDWIKSFDDFCEKLKTSATILYEDNELDHVINILDGEDINYIYADVMGFFKEYYGSSLSLCKCLMDDMRTPVNTTTVPHDSCLILKNLISALQSITQTA